MAFNTNAWYSVQNFGNDWYLGCQGIGACTTGERGLSDAEHFQIAPVNGSETYYLRPRAQKANSNGEPYCVNIQTGVPTVTTCDNLSAIWGIGNWTANSTGDGTYFFNTQKGSSQRLYLSNGQLYSLLNYNGLPQSEVVLMEWAMTSRAAINDQSYSTVPIGIVGGTTTTATTTSGSICTSTLTSNGNNGTSSGQLLSTTAPTQSTVTMLITPTVTASPSSTSRISSSSSIPAVVGSNGGGKIITGAKTALALMVALPYVLPYLL